MFVPKVRSVPTLYAPSSQPLLSTVRRREHYPCLRLVFLLSHFLNHGARCVAILVAVWKVPDVVKNISFLNLHNLSVMETWNVSG